MSTQTKKQFTDLVEEIFGSRSPDLHHHAAYITKFLKTWRERHPTGAEKKLLEVKETHLKATVKFAHIGLSSWERLDDEMKAVIVELLQKSAEQFDRELYLFGHSN